MNKIYIKTLLLIISIFILTNFVTKAQPNIIINEISQGDAGDHEWIELVVTEDGTDIRGIYLTTEAVGFDVKSVQLSKTLAAFASVNKGFIIVIYKAGAPKDAVLPPVDDDNPATNSRIIIPSDNTTCLEPGSSWAPFIGDGSNICLFTDSGDPIHAVTYGPNSTISGLFGPGTWGQVSLSTKMAAGTPTASIYYTQQSSGQAGNSANWGVRANGSATPGVIDGADDRSIPVSSHNIIINEISQGDRADHDWIELVVTKDGTDIQGVYFTTEAVGFDVKSVQLRKTLPAFASVNKGFIIVVYKAKAKDASLPADDEDPLTNSRIIIPSDNTTFLDPGSVGWPGFKSKGSNIGLLTDGGVGIHALAYGNGVLSTIFGPGTWGQDYIPTTMTAGDTTASLHYIEGTASDVYNSANWVYSTNTDVTPGALNGGNNNALPVELSSFSAVINKNSVKLVWETQTEVNNYGFEVQRSTRDENWRALGFVNGNGNSNSPKNYSFEDKTVNTSGSYSYRLKQIDNDGSYEYSKCIEVNLGTPVSTELKQNYPNPFNPTTTINFTLPASDQVSLVVYNAIGEQVKVLYNGMLEAGVHSFNFNGDELPSGLYVYKLSTSSNTQIKKMMLLK